MKNSSLKFSNYRPRYKIKNTARLMAVILVFLLTITAVLVILAKVRGNSDDKDGLKPEETIDVSTPTPTPEPTPTPYPVPEGKVMEPFLVMLDPGHGDLDGGTVSPYIDGLYEKDIVLDIAKKVESILIEKGINVILTREDDMRPVQHSEEDLVARWSFANEQKASLFVSIHVNAYDLKFKGAASVNGMEIYYFEDKQEVYTDFTQQRFAEIMRDSITAANGITFRFMEGERRLAVVRNTTMPAVLIETAYITNKEDNDRLNSQEFREKTAGGIADGIVAAMEEIGVFKHDGEMYVFKETGE
ncbi:MAG TPA: N-acetylmuramoyl-L-alanine amidase [Clostridiaceae bacterium]|jgi:N-acetylmuramoyl-L-alanine amidase|nr:N-acetylmuramoyl-L-alanine amidase [Clostridiaceae bacterium]